MQYSEIIRILMRLTIDDAHILRQKRNKEQNRAIKNNREIFQFNSFAFLYTNFDIFCILFHNSIPLVFCVGVHLIHSADTVQGHFSSFLDDNSTNQVNQHGIGEEWKEGVLAVTPEYTMPRLFGEHSKSKFGREVEMTTIWKKMEGGGYCWMTASEAGNNEKGKLE